MAPAVAPGAGRPPAERLARLAGRLARAAGRTRLRTDAEAIHDTRVTLRRLEATLDVWRDALRPGRRRRARRALRQLRRVLGAAREAEVNAALLGERLGAGTQAAASPALQDVLARLERRRDRARRRAASACRREVVDRALRRLRRVSRPLAEAAEADEQAVMAARGGAERRAMVARTTLAEAARSGDEAALHRARITLKRWRYGLEALAGMDAGMAQVSPAALTAAQECLGTLHDFAVLRATLLAWAQTVESQDPRAGAPLHALIAALEDESRRESGRLPGLAAALIRPPIALSAAPRVG